MRGTRGQWIKVLVFLDNGSETSMALEKLMKQTGYWCKRRNGAPTTISGVGEQALQLPRMKLPFGSYSMAGEEFTVSAITGSKITGKLNPVNWAVEKMNFPHLKRAAD